MKARELLIVGNGMVADRLVDEMLGGPDPDAWRITVVSDEPHGAYNRVLLTDVLAGASPEQVITKPAAWYGPNGVRLVDTAVTRLDVARRQAILSDHSVIGYDHAVLATGGQAIIPPIGGIARHPDGHINDEPGVFVFRSMDDCLRIRAAADPAHGPLDALVIGGGLLGLEAAHALLGLGHRVSIVHPTVGLLNAQLDETAGAFLRRAVEHTGINVVNGRVASILAKPGCPPDGVVLDDGVALPANLVVITVGVRPRIEVAVASGIDTALGVLVDNALATSAPAVSAIGDCAQHPATTGGLVAPGWEQAEVLARRLTGADPEASYTGTTTHTRLKVAGIEVAALGDCQPDPLVDEVVVVEEGRGVYRKLCLREGVLVGALVVGDPFAAAPLMQRIERSETVPADPIDLLCSPAAFTTEATSDRVVCVCNRVTERALRDAVRAGAGTTEELMSATRAGTGCGSCVSQLEGFLGCAAAAAR